MKVNCYECRIRGVQSDEALCKTRLSACSLSEDGKARPATAHSLAPLPFSGETALWRRALSSVTTSPSCYFSCQRLTTASPASRARLNNELLNYFRLRRAAHRREKESPIVIISRPSCYQRPQRPNPSSTRPLSSRTDVASPTLPPRSHRRHNTTRQSHNVRHPRSHVGLADRCLAHN